MSNLEDLGVQRVVINLYNHLPPEIDPVIVFWSKQGKLSSFFTLKGAVYETDNHNKPLKSFFRQVRYLSIIKKEKPDIVLSFIPGTNVAIALLKKFLPSSLPLVASEHAFISRAFTTGEYPGKFGTLYKRMIPYMYNKAFDKLIMLAHVGKKDAVDSWGINPNNIEIIYNPQDIDDITHKSLIPVADDWFNDGSPIIIGVGRLAPQKGFDKLIDAFAILSQKVPNAKLAILGRGELETSLKEQVQKYHSESRVKFLGFQSNPYQYLKKASIFALSSVWEAMPMVMCEAMVAGVPIVSFDCPSGPKELLGDGVRGFLVKDQDVPAFAKTLEYALTHYSEAEAKAAIGEKWAIDTLNAEYVTHQYVSMLKSVISNKKQN